MKTDDRRIKTRSYYYALGEFVDRYAAVEKFFHMFFHKYAGIDIWRAAAIKRSMKASELISIIKKLLPLREYNDADAAEAAALFEQFAHISEFRDRVIHRGGSEKADGKFQSSNLATMVSKDLMEVTEFTIKDIRNASRDLERIAMRLAFNATRAPRNSLAKSLFSPWRYKPVVLRNPYRQSQAKPQTPKPRP